MKNLFQTRGCYSREIIIRFVRQKIEVDQGNELLRHEFHQARLRSEHEPDRIHRPDSPSYTIRGERGNSD